MASVKFGGGIVQISGSIGGSTFARNRSGNYIRPRTKPVNPNSDDQQKIRSIIALLTEEWNDTLTIANRAAWGVYASNVAMKNKLGETIHLSGFNHFIRSGANRLYIGLPFVPAGPVDFTLPDKDPILTIDVDEAPQLITVTFDAALEWNQEAFGSLSLYQGLPQNGTRNFFAGPWHLLWQWYGTPGGAQVSPVNLTPYYPVALGQKCWCRFRIGRADGRLSEPWSVSTTVHAAAPGEVPNVVGMTQIEAEARLTLASLVLGEVTSENSETVPVNLIISSDPAAGTRLEAGASVNIVLSLGPAP